MAPRKFVRISMIIDHTKVYDILELAEGNALAGSLEIVPVRHGGEKESGELTPAPTAEKFLNDWLAKHQRIDTKAVMAPAEQVGITRNSIYAQIKRMTDRKQIKRVEVGAYLPVARKGRPAAEAATPAKEKHQRKQTLPGGETAADRLVREVAAKQQNGSGDGVSLADLKKVLTKEGYVPTGVGPALTLLVNKNRLVRVGKGMYRTPPNAPPPREASEAMGG